ncbi:hypothetical protein K488DRAFT_72835 [Vararia minispora EC-137]|uniref:Uncharacterized protein n=1 Tax=Vararia minispora EC-137 TaxID=1314806 RepID=A0ACB8QD77_9AGAM|nr:hypothetical protein K488DRAFT_72835 [Vararia minispora EC-137]
MYRAPSTGMPVPFLPIVSGSRHSDRPHSHQQREHHSYPDRGGSDHVSATYAALFHDYVPSQLPPTLSRGAKPSKSRSKHKPSLSTSHAPPPQAVPYAHAGAAPRPVYHISASPAPARHPPELRRTHSTEHHSRAPHGADPGPAPRDRGYHERERERGRSRERRRPAEAPATTTGSSWLQVPAAAYSSASSAPPTSPSYPASYSYAGHHHVVDQQLHPTSAHQQRQHHRRDEASENRHRHQHQPVSASPQTASRPAVAGPTSPSARAHTHGSMPFAAYVPTHASSHGASPSPSPHPPSRSPLRPPKLPSPRVAHPVPSKVPSPRIHHEPTTAHPPPITEIIPARPRSASQPRHRTHAPARPALRSHSRSRPGARARSRGHVHFARSGDRRREMPFPASVGGGSGRVQNGDAIGGAEVVCATTVSPAGMTSTAAHIPLWLLVDAAGHAQDRSIPRSK